MIRLAGGRDVVGREGGPSSQVAWTQVVTSDPEIVVLMPCSFDLTRTLEELDRIAFPRAWCDMTAVRTGRVYAVDAARYFSRSGPSTVDGLDILGEIIHPEVFARRSSPDSWRRVVTA
jgi:iron complex transport system substrate-binding protein